MTTAEAVILAIIEGLTEFLPVSSTGHMIIGESFMKMQPSAFLKVFTVAVQLGAILSVVVIYFRYFFKSINFYYKLLFAFIPSAVLGFLLGDKIDQALENPVGVSIALLAGGVFLLFVDRMFKNQHVSKSENIDYLTAIKIGFFQCLALFPGVSRSGATIIGGMSQKMTRQAAAEFSFFLAVPTMLAATGYSLFLKKWEVSPGVKEKGYEIILSSSENIKAFAIGNVVAFVVAILAIKLFIGFLSKYGFKLFGWYRIILGIALLVIHYCWFRLQVI
jgi:undecaprenyl-diphosphatase